jgi:hypothetical protein
METIKNNTRVKWQDIESERKQSTFALKRFDSNCLANFYIGINENNNKCILHDLDKVVIEFNGFEKTNLKAYKTDNYLILELIGNDDYFDIYLDLSCSIFNTIKDIPIPQNSAEIFKEMILKWSSFFSNKKYEKLGEKELMGLWGEISVLNSLITKNEVETNIILNSWRGPYDSNRDFEFSSKHIEVKTIKHDGEFVDISSEFQLSIENDLEVELRVLKVRQVDDGFSIKHIIEETISEIIKNNGQLDLFYSALYQKVNILELNEYENICFAIFSDRTYDVNNDDFPKISTESLMDGISKVKYKISLSQIELFLKIDL